MSEERALVPASQQTDLVREAEIDPDELLEIAMRKARALAKIIEDCSLSVSIGKGKHTKVEGWTTLATMNGCCVTQIGDAVRRDDGAWVVRAGLKRMRDGVMLAEAEHECGGPDDENWEDRSEYAKRSMALTRAIGKVCRMNYSWIMVLAGYEATPAEEMPREPIFRAPEPAVVQHPPLSSAAPPPGEDDGKQSDPRNWYPQGIPVIDFGKHKGKTVLDLDDQYIAWGVSNIDNAARKNLLSRELDRRMLRDQGE